MPERSRRWLRWLVPGALLALAPKCGLCLLGYFGVGAALGIGGPEICGAVGDTTAHARVWLLVASLALGVAWYVARARCRAASQDTKPD